MAFSLKKSWINGGRSVVVEVLKDGLPLNAENKLEGKFWGKEHFGFGTEKAELILESMDFIETFLDMYPKINLEPRDYAKCRAEVRFDFAPKNQTFPYVYLKNTPNPAPKKDIGFGKTKAEAVVDLKNDLENFVRKYA